MEFLNESEHQISPKIFRIGEEMEALRHSNLNGKVGSNPTGLSPPNPNQQGQGLVAILIMITVLIFILAYCCWGAPCCRSLCHRNCCCNSANNVESQQTGTDYNLNQCASTPTIILLPYGRMLVVDGTVFAQFQADTTGIDLLELGESVVRAQQEQMLTPNSFVSTPSLIDIDSETNSKDFNLPSPMSSLPPPTYESLFGDNHSLQLPPSYSETFRNQEVEVIISESELENIRESTV